MTTAARAGFAFIGMVMFVAAHVVFAGFIFAIIALQPARAQSNDEAAVAEPPPIFARGDAAVTSFSGTKPSANIPKGAHQLDVTFIDPEGISLRVFDLKKLGGPPRGQLIGRPQKFAVKSGRIGQVFGVTHDTPQDPDTPPNIYAAATSLYGLHIVGEQGGAPIRLVLGSPKAKWMPGQFGTDNGGGPGSIWRIDGATGEITLFSEIFSGGQLNAGPGLGGLTHDPVTGHFYVTSLETGLIHHLDETGRDLGTFDHGTTGRAGAGLDAVGYDPSRRMDITHPSFNIEKPQTWGYAEPKRRVVAVAIEGGRLYYSLADGPQVWSVGLDSQGGFMDDARAELDLLDTPSGNMITDIAFDGPNRLYVTQRGDLASTYDYSTFARPQAAVVVRYTWNEEDQRWADASQEFAVGLRPPHRATNGGIALGYGYEETGAIDVGRCRETLWTTGERLRDGAKEGPSIVHGLQGIATAGAQERATWRPTSGSAALTNGFGRADLTTLEPPVQSWFLDKDGRAGDEHAYGHLGALTIYAPCDGAGEEAESRPEAPEIAMEDGPDFFPDFPGVDPEIEPPINIPPIVPPGDFPGLDIAKTCDPAAFGGNIACTITVTNTGTLVFDYPITVTDAATIAMGPGAGGAIDIAAVTPDGPEWACTPTPATNVTCGLPPLHLQPGTSRSFVVEVSTAGLIADGNTGFQNCAYFGAPHWGIACDNAGTDITVTKTAQPGCVAGGDCKFTLAITNNGATPFNGALQLTDEMFLGAVGGPLMAPAAFNGDLGCGGGNPAAVPFSCLANVSLAAGATRSIDMSVTMPAAPPNYWARNCFAATAPGLIPGDLATTMPPGGGALGSGGAVSCAWMQVGAPGPHSNLRMQKTAQACGKLPGDPNTVSCDYTIAILNSGPTDFNAPIDFDELVDPAATLTSNDAAWTCAGGAPNHTCGSGGANVAIPSGSSIAIPVNITTPRDVVEAAACSVPNTVTLTNPPVNAVTNYLAADDTATAVGDAFLLEFDAGGAAIILCDPTNLKTTQVAKGPCAKSGDNWRCVFDLTVTNTGPDPYKGIITLADQFSIAPTSISVTGGDGWGQKPAAGGALFGLPKRTIPKGDRVSLSLAVEIPDGNHCKLTNIADMTFPVLKRHNSNKSDDRATATAMIPRPECKKEPQCRKPARGEMQTASGACVCREGFVRDGTGLCREPDPQSPVTPEEPPQENCPDGQRWDERKESCVPEGTTTPEPPEAGPDDGVIIPPPPPAPLCRLKPGQVRNKTGDCVCANGRIWNAATQCRPCHKGDVKCQCKLAGKPYNPRTNRCGLDEVIDPPPPVVDPQKECISKGWWWVRGQCVRPCKRGDIKCQCKLAGKPYNPRTNRCGLDEAVEPPPAEACRKRGGRWNGQRCIVGLTPAEACRKRGGRWNGQRCIIGPTPAEACRKRGGRWNGQRCIVGPTPAEACRKRGGRWNGQRCIVGLTPAEACRKRGGRWNGQRCFMGPTPAQKCRAKGGVWKGGRCVPRRKPCPRGYVGPGQPNCKKIGKPSKAGNGGKALRALQRRQQQRNLGARLRRRDR